MEINTLAFTLLPFLGFALAGNPKANSGRTASWPSPAEEELADTLSFEEWLVPNKESCFLVSVGSENMQEEGIRKGDTLIIERGRGMQSGDFMIAEIDNKWSLKKAEIEEGRFVLIDGKGNKERKFRIVGVVTAVIRKYH